MATWGQVVEWLGGVEVGGAVRVVVGGRAVLVFPPRGDVARLVTPMPDRVGRPALRAELIAEGAWLDHRGRAYLQTSLAIGRIPPTALAGAVRGFAATADDLSERLRPPAVAVWCANYAE
jgi:hypothetical protein